MDHQIMYMKDWVERLDVFLQFNRMDILENKGKVTAEIAKSFAENEFSKYKIKQDALYESDFDKLVFEIDTIKHRGIIYHRLYYRGK